MSCPRLLPHFACLAVLVLAVPATEAATCTVPSSSHETIQEAVDDIGCTEIELAPQLFIESLSLTRSLVLRGESSSATTIEGRVVVTGASTSVSLQSLTIDGSALPVKGCFEVVLDVADGGRVAADDDVVVINTRAGDCPIFADGLELGDSSRWSRVVSP